MATIERKRLKVINDVGSAAKQTQYKKSIQNQENLSLFF